MAVAKGKLGAVLFRPRKKLRGGQAVHKRRRRIDSRGGGCGDLCRKTTPPATKKSPKSSSNNNICPIIRSATDGDDHAINKIDKATTPIPQHHTTRLIRETAAPPPPAAEIPLSRPMALRAEMMRVRYAETIAKASQKKLGDPNWKAEEEEEAMRLRRRRQQIERERAAARIAVDKIQKTVEFNDAHSLMMDFHTRIYTLDMAAAKAKLGAVLFRSKKRPRGGQAVQQQATIHKRRRRIDSCGGGGGDLCRKTAPPTTKALKSSSSNNHNSPIIRAARDGDHAINKIDKTTPSPHPHTTRLTRETAAPPPAAAVEIPLSRPMALRAAMMKVRYAETIAKASQKKLGDRNWKAEEEEAMRLRRRREQIERERAAARIAVDKIQKTVEFNDAHSLMIDFYSLICSSC
ncbi:unnamed protein product [Cuscuta campestris]|uniref:Uncharacterized protein n=1 Tax=Cuscuta campestris TaxID=132261 RepID=A0A484NK88_9ASTE|nr:unnamed protein product [Cuscuta campestris]